MVTQFLWLVASPLTKILAEKKRLDITYSVPPGEIRGVLDSDRMHGEHFSCFYTSSRTLLEADREDGFIRMLGPRHSPTLVESRLLLASIHPECRTQGFEQHSNVESVCEQ